MVVSCMAKKNSPRDATESPFLRSKITKIMETKTNCKMYWRVIGHILSSYWIIQHAIILLLG